MNADSVYNSQQTHTSHKDQLVNSVSWNNDPSLWESYEPTDKTTQEETVMLWCLQDLTFKCSDTRSLQMCKMRFSDYFYTHEYRPDSGMKLLLNQILRCLTFIHNFIIQLKMEHKMGDRNYCSPETSQVLPESDTRKISLGGRKLKRPRTWALLASTAHAVPVETGAVSKHHSPPPQKMCRKQELCGRSAGMRVNAKQRLDGN